MKVKFKEKNIESKFEIYEIFAPHACFTAGITPSYL